MQEYWKVLCGKNEAGLIRINQAGLYVLFEGRLDLPKNKIWRIIARSNDQTLDLGICILESSGFIIRKKLPAKYFNEASWRFEAVDIAAPARQCLSEDRPFDDLDRIEQGRLARNEDGSIFIFYRDQ